MPPKTSKPKQDVLAARRRLEARQAERQLLFRRCQTPDELRQWMLVHFALELPDGNVDPDSNSNPFAFVWEIYELALRGGDENVSEEMAYASRQSYKTLLAAILEILMVFHHKRDVIHLAAIESQSARAQKYVRSFLNHPSMAEFVSGDNKRTINIVWYEGCGQWLTSNEYQALPLETRIKYREQSFEIQIVVCTESGVQGPHGEFAVVDEVDVIRNPQTYLDAKMIPSERVDRGQFPITVYISTRKSSFGLVQKEIDNAPETGLVVRHWNILDVTAPCPPTRHLPHLPKLPVYVDSAELRTVEEEEVLRLPPEKRAAFVKHEAYAGCLSNCRLFASCRGLLATEQKSTALSLKSVAATQLAFRRLGGNAGTANSQLLSRKPSSEGLVYPRLDPDVHLLKVAEIAELMGAKVQPTPAAFVKSLVDEYGAYVSVGMDFGYTHNFAVTVAVILKPWCVVFDGFEVAELEMMQQISLCEERIKQWDPIIWPDMAGAVNIASFKRAKFRIRAWKKGAGTLDGGIQILRGKLRPAISEPEMLFVSESQGARLVFDRLSKYHYLKNAAGEWTSEPSEEGDDLCDSCRYLVMNEFPVKSQGVKLAPHIEAEEPEPPQPSPQDEARERQRQYFAEMMAQTGMPYTPQVQTKKGRFQLLT